MSTPFGSRLGRWPRWSLGLLTAATLILAGGAPVVRADPPGVHVVKSGDSLIAIAAAHGVTTDALIAANGLTDPNRLAVGQELVLPGSQARPAAAASPGRHTVQPGDTLIAIAARFDVEVDHLRRANGLGASDLIRVGDELTIPGRPEPSSRGAAPRPAATPSRYTVVAGDTLSGIAARLGVDQSELAAANHLTDPNRLRVGDELIVPDGTAPASPAAAVGGQAVPSPAPAGARQHIVQAGENLLRIAAGYGVEVAALAAANGLADRNRIGIGQVLTIPGAAPAAPPAAPPPAPPAAPAPAAGEWAQAKITYYCMGGRMSNGQPVHEGAAAADPSVYPLGTTVEVEGIGKFTIEDRFGRDLGQQRLDLWTPDCGAALRFGIRYRNVRVVGP